LSDKKDYHCSFCGKHKNEINTLIAGPATYICNECIDLCHSIVHERKSVDNKTTEVNSDIPTPEDINEFLNAHVIGQDEAKEVLSVAVYNHYKRINLPEDDDEVELEKSNVMMLGPSGTGKTLLGKTIAKFLDVPFAQVDATTLTESGYVGEDVENVIQRLLMASDFDIKKAEQGIIYIDEIDKKAKKGESISITKDVSGEGVQQALLKIVEGTVVRVPPGGGRKHPGAEMLEVDTSKILFIVGGAFVGLDKVIKRRLNANGSIGFGARVMAQDSADDMRVSEEVLPEDVIRYGIIPEFMGRFPILVGINDLTKDELSRILTEPKNNLMAQFKKIFKLDGVELNLTKDAINEISEIAKSNKTGARGLRSVLEKSLLKLQFKLPKLAKQGLVSVEITGDFIKHNKEPILVFTEEIGESTGTNEEKL
jgi:ATP-dependent Clp protease ATP-binding subunit ClpX